MTGTIVNTVAIIAGGTIGWLVKKGISKNIEDSVMKMLGLSVFFVGLIGVFKSMISVDKITGALSDKGGILLLVSLVFGIIAGELLKIDDRLNIFGKWIEKKVGAQDFGKGFVNASLIFCIGAMAIVGALNDGLLHDPQVLFMKSSLDFVCAIVLASGLGIGVAFSAVPVLLYQGSITLLSGVVAPLISDVLLNNICMVGYAIVFCIGVNFLGMCKIKTANLLPALLVPVLYSIIF